LTKLRTLQLRERWCHDCHDFGEESDDVYGDIERQAHLFAKDFFAHLEKQSSCPSLDTLVLGMENQVTNSKELQVRNRGKEMPPARCFRRTRKIRVDESTRSESLPISLAEFRATSDYTEVLDWYTGCECLCANCV